MLHSNPAFSCYGEGFINDQSFLFILQSDKEVVLPLVEEGRVHLHGKWRLNHLEHRRSLVSSLGSCWGHYSVAGV